MGKGWICLHRDLEDNWLWKDKPFSKGQAWVDLLIMANHEDNKGIYKGEAVVFKRGTVNRSIASLSERWGWSRKKTRVYLSALESDGMVTVKATTNCTTITVENYSVYQDQGPTKGATKEQRGYQRRNSEGTTNNNDNNYNNEKQSIRAPAPSLEDDEAERIRRLAR